MKEIEATYLEELHRWDETVIIYCRLADGSYSKIKTTAEEAELSPGLSYLFYGRWTETKYGNQFFAKTFIETRPHNRDGIITYLKKKCRGVGQAIATGLWQSYKTEAVKMLRENPEEAANKLKSIGVRFSQKKALQAAEDLKEVQALENVTIELFGLLVGRGLPKNIHKKLLHRFGNVAPDFIRRNAYLLMQFSGCGFARADSLYIDLGGRPDRLKRQTLCCWHAMYSNGDGHTWYPPDFFRMALKEKIAGTAIQPVKALKLGLRGKLLDVERGLNFSATNGSDPTTPWIAIKTKADHEKYVAMAVNEIRSEKHAWPDPELLDIEEEKRITAHQKEQLKKALISPIAILGGSPGTGKTVSASKVVRQLIKEYGANQVAVVAPTGKAAVRITEAMQENGVSITAKTIHSFLGVEEIKPDGTWVFRHNEEEPIDERFVIVDEVSMCDVDIVRHLLAARRVGGHFFFVGDIQQLSPVGHGAPLRDFIQAGISYGELTEIRRNSGLIVETCAKIRDEVPFYLPSRLNLEARQNLALISARDGDVALQQIVGLIKRIATNRRSDPVWDVQVISAVNERSALCRNKINTLLQAELNGENRSKAHFWLNDKVINLKNQQLPVVKSNYLTKDNDPELDDYRATSDGGEQRVYVANGEIGRVLEEHKNKTIIEFTAPRRVVLVPKTESGHSAVDLAYAITCHKSQGSQWPIVIIALDEYYGARMVCDRSWIYTAISRAEKACILVGKDATLKAFCQKQKIHKRKTFLVERILSGES